MLFLETVTVTVVNLAFHTTYNLTMGLCSMELMQWLVSYCDL